MVEAAAVNERDFLQQVKDLARLCGWRVYHTLDSRGSDPGFPDLVLVRRGQLVFAELKTDSGKPTAAQTAWLADLGRVHGVDVHLWRPSDWPQIEAMLASRAAVGDRGSTFR